MSESGDSGSSGTRDAGTEREGGLTNVTHPNGCGCRAAGAPAGRRAGMLAALACGLVLVSRRRRRR
jgi:MYXO-CTERM domain-containing protein